MEKNTFCHVEIPTTNINKAKNFYENLFGWQVRPTPDPGYALIPGGGLRKVDRVAGGGTLNYVFMEDIDSYLDRVQQLGGKVQIKKEPAGNGWCATFSDTEGNVIGLYTE